MFGGVSLHERAECAENLAVMLKSGVTINEALLLLSQKARSGALQSILARIQKEVEMGMPLSEALEKERKTFGAVFVGMVSAGEKSGTLEENLMFLAEWLQRSEDLKNEVDVVLLYPKIVTIATLLLGGGLSVLVLPRLVPLFNNLRVELPVMTRVLLSVSLFVSRFWYVLIAGAFCIIAAGYLLQRIAPTRKILHAFYLRIPYVGNMVASYHLALITRLFSTLLKSGVSLSESMGILETVAANESYRRSLRVIGERVMNGVPLSEAMKDHERLYRWNTIALVEVGEKSGTLEGSFAHLSEYYTKEVKNFIKKLPSIIEPALLVVIGITVGLVAMGIILPIYQLTRGIR